MEEAAGQTALRSICWVVVLHVRRNPSRSTVAAWGACRREICPLSPIKSMKRLGDRVLEGIPFMANAAGHGCRAKSTMRN